MKKILIVDDEKEIAELLSVYFVSEGFSVLTSETISAAKKIIENNRIDIALLDVMLPDGDGFSLCRNIREKYTFPIIMLTAKDAELDKITGLTFGADDYITKPFRPLEVVARVKAQLRRSSFYNKPSEETEEGIYELEGMLLNINSHECSVDGEVLNLTPTEFQILQALFEHRGSVMSAESLFHEVWKEEYFDKNTNPVTVHIRHLREKMHDTENPKYIKTVWGLGYKIEK